MELSQAIRELRKATGDTQQSLAVKLGLAVASVSRYETGASAPITRIRQQLFKLAQQHGRRDLQAVFLFGDGAVAMDAPNQSGLDYACRECKREMAQHYNQSESGKAARSAYLRRAGYGATAARKREQREEMRKALGMRIKARHLVGKAVKSGYMPKPEPTEDWWNRWEFHHPDHSRPYYGAWVKQSDHAKIERGELPAPEYVDYSEIVRQTLLSRWGFNL